MKHTRSLFSYSLISVAVSAIKEVIVYETELFGEMFLEMIFREGFFGVTPDLRPKQERRRPEKSWGELSNKRKREVKSPRDRNTLRVTKDQKSPSRWQDPGEKECSMQRLTGEAGSKSGRG